MKTQIKKQIAFTLVLCICISLISFVIGMHVESNQQRTSDEQITRILKYALNTPILIYNTTEDTQFNNTTSYEPILGTVTISNVTFLDGYYINASKQHEDWGK